jgi:hypothetical protein
MISRRTEQPYICTWRWGTRFWRTSKFASLPASHASSVISAMSKERYAKRKVQLEPIAKELLTPEYTLPPIPLLPRLLSLFAIAFVTSQLAF